MRIHGHKVPTALASLLNADKKLIFEREILEEMSGLKIGLSIPCGLYYLEEETKALVKIQKSETKSIYGTEADSSPAGTKIDADYCLCLGVNHDEEGLCLDYRGSTDEPAVYLSGWRGQPEEHDVWVRISDNFSEFIDRYQKLDEQSVPPKSDRAGG